MPRPNPISRLPLAVLAIAASLAGTAPALADHFKQAADSRNFPHEKPMPCVDPVESMQFRNSE